MATRNTKASSKSIVPPAAEILLGLHYYGLYMCISN